MNLNRRSFIERAALGTAGLVAATTARSATADPRPSLLPTFDERSPEIFWQAVRAQFPLTRDRIYFNTGGLGPAPQPVLDVAAETTRKLQERSEHGHEMMEPAREVVAHFLGAEASEIAFVRNATEATGIVAAGLKLAPGDEVIFESHAHPGGSFPWLNQEKLRGVKVKLFDPDARDPNGNLARITALMTARTRVVQVSHVTAPTGIVMPAAEISKACRARGIWFHIDGAQSAGMFPFSLHEIGCDSFATSGHKWLGGPLETGVLFVRRDRLEDVAPLLVGAYSSDLNFLPGEFQLVPTAVRYEYGTRNTAAVLALAEAVRFQERIGRERIAARGRALVAQLRSGLARIPGVEILTPDAPAMSAAMLTFRTEAVPFTRMFERLLKEHAIRARPVSEQRLNAVRVSTHLFNSPAECDTLLKGVAAILRERT